MFSSVILNNSSKKSLSSSRAKNEPIPENEPLDTYLRKKAEEYYYKLASQQLTQQQMQINFSKDILTHFLTNLTEKNMSQTYIENTQQNIRQNMVFLKTMYPQPKNSILNRHIFEGLKQVDHTEKVQFDLLANLDMKFTYSNPYGSSNTKERDGSRMQILSQIQTFFNELIKCSQKSIKQFSSLLTEQIPKKLAGESKQKYNSLLKQPWKFDLENDITKTHLYNKDLVSERLFFSSVQLFKIIEGWVEKLEEILVAPEGYFEKTQILKMDINGKFNQARLRNIRKHANKIFNKFQTNDSGSSVDEENPQVKAKSEKQTVATNDEEEWFFVRIFNKVRKMCNGQQDTKEQFQRLQMPQKYQPLEHSTQDPQTQPSIQNTQSYKNFAFKSSGYPVSHYPESLQQLASEIGYPNFCEQQLQFLYKAYLQTIRVVDKNKNKQKYTIEEKKVYAFCSNLYCFMEEIVIERLVKIISGFILLKEKGEVQFRKWSVFRDIEVVKFCQKNVVEAFIVADQKVLMDVYNAIVELAKTRQAKIAQIQNRFGTAHNDSTIILKIKNNPILCKLRLRMDQLRTGPESKQKSLSQMYDFLSKIEKFPYGPISYLSLILATKDHKINYLNSIRKSRLEGNVQLADVCHCGKGNVSERNSVNTFEKEVKNIIGEDGAVRLDCYRRLVPSSFVCGVCEKVIKKGETVIPVPCCTECGFHICIECSFENNPRLQVQTYSCLINQVAKIVDPCYYSELQLTEENKKNYNHSYTKDVQVLSNMKPEVKKQIYYNIMLESNGFVRFRKYMKEAQFWESVREKINLKNIQEYKEVIKIDKFIGILFKPRQLLRQKGQPFTFISYDTTANKFHKFVYKSNEQRVQQTAVTTKQLNVSENDAFIPILWIFGESLVTEYISKVLQTNPFYVKRMPMRDLSMDHMRFSRSKISSHHIMK